MFHQLVNNMSITTVRSNFRTKHIEAKKVNKFQTHFEETGSLRLNDDRSCIK